MREKGGAVVVMGERLGQSLSFVEVGTNDDFVEGQTKGLGEAGNLPSLARECALAMAVRRLRP